MPERILLGSIDGFPGEKGDTGAGFPQGGAKGQMLSKKSGTDYDTEWAYPVKALVLESAGDLAVGTSKAFVPVPFNMEITKVKAQVLAAPTGSSLILDINVNGSSIYTTQANRPTITAGDYLIEAELPDDVSLETDDMITIDIDQVGSTVAGSNLAVTITCDVVVNEPL